MMLNFLYEGLRLTHPFLVNYISRCVKSNTMENGVISLLFVLSFQAPSWAIKTFMSRKSNSKCSQQDQNVQTLKLDSSDWPNFESLYNLNACATIPNMISESICTLTDIYLTCLALNQPYVDTGTGPLVLYGRIRINFVYHINA